MAHTGWSRPFDDAITLPDGCDLRRRQALYRQAGSSQLNRDLWNISVGAKNSALQNLVLLWARATIYQARGLRTGRSSWPGQAAGDPQAPFVDLVQRGYSMEISWPGQAASDP
jgi:hypothetical protein